MTVRVASRGTTIIFAALSGFTLVGAVTACTSGQSTDAEPAPTTPAASAPTPSTGGGPTEVGGAGASTYQDGSYQADGSYQSPNGSETVTVDITLEDDIITAVTVTPHPTNPNTRQFQGAFAGAISGAVVGKDIDDISVSKLAGSSLTSGGFNDAVDQIKADAS